jgi:sugar/nucleoside kinase (ribokinase family)
LIPSKQPEYLCIGHLTIDKTPAGDKIGGTAAYASLTAQAMGLDTALYTTYTQPQLPSLFASIQSEVQVETSMMTFENIYHEEKRTQHLLHTCNPLQLSGIPPQWFDASIIHFGPIFHDIAPESVSHFPNAFIGMTPQGWLRTIEGQIVRPKSWEWLRDYLPHADAVVISVEDVGYDEDAIQTIASISRILAVTEGFYGARIYHEGTVHRCHAPELTEIDPTGAGDIFSTIFFIMLQKGNSPHLAGQLATQLASFSVLRRGLKSIPTKKEIDQAFSQLSQARN